MKSLTRSSCEELKRPGSSGHISIASRSRAGSFKSHTFQSDLCLVWQALICNITNYLLKRMQCRFIDFNRSSDAPLYHFIASGHSDSHFHNRLQGSRDISLGICVNTPIHEKYLANAGSLTCLHFLSFFRLLLHKTLLYSVLSRTMS